MKIIQAALCSYGMSGEVFHAPLLSSHPGIKLKSIFERSGDKAAQKYPGSVIVKSYQDILHDIAIDLVVVNTPNQYHYTMAKEALMAGKNVVVEKPFTITTVEARELIDLAKEKKIVLSVFHNKRLENDFLTIKEIIDHHLIGTAVELEVHYDRYRTHITHKKWKEDNVPGAGTLYDLGVHLIDMALQLFGQPESINADLRILRKEAQSFDYFNLRFEYPTFRAILRSSTMVREQGPQIMLHGDKGSFIKYGSDPQEQQLKDGLLPGMKGWGEEDEENYGLLNTELNGEIIKRPYKSAVGCYEKFYDNIYQAIVNKKPLMVNPDQAMLAVRMVELAEESNRRKQSVKV